MKTRRILALLLCLALMCPAFALADAIEITDADPVATESGDDSVDIEFDEGVEADIEAVPELEVDLALALDDGLVAVEPEPEEPAPAIEANEDTTGKSPLSVAYSGPTLTKVYDCTNNIFKKNAEGVTVYAITPPKAADFTLSGMAADHGDVQINIASIKRNADGSSYLFPAADAGSYTLKLTFGLSGADAGLYYCEPVSIPAAITPREVVVTPRSGLSKVYGAKDPVYKADSWLNSDESSPLHQEISGLPGYAVPINTVDGKSKLTVDDGANGAYLLRCAQIKGTKFFPEGWLDRESGEDAGRYRITLGDMGFGDNFTVTLKEEYFTITPRSIADEGVTAEAIPDQTYTGKVRKPVPSLSYNGQPLTVGEDFSCAYKNNRTMGTATVTVTGMGNFTGSRRFAFKILPRATAISKLTAGKGKVTVSWKKISGVTGYQVAYSLKSDFSSQVKKNVKGANKKSLTLKGLKSNKIYYFRIRTYRIVNGKYYCSPWSRAKKTRVK